MNLRTGRNSDRESNPSMVSAVACTLGVALALVCGASFAQATAGAAGSPLTTEGKPQERNISDWLMRMHEASRKRAYIGTFVVSSTSSMSSARIWHICDGEQQVERIEALTGAPRSTFRRNDEVITFHADTKTALSEKRESMGLFPNLLKAADSGIAQLYSAKHLGVERVAGFDADVVQLSPRDNLRFGYRVWSEKKTGLVVKLQTLDIDGRVIEQAAYSELQMDAPVSMARLTQMMGNVEGYKVEKPELVKTTALAEGWVLKAPVAGFKPMSCYKRAVARSDGSAVENAMQWIFSDGLASVSVFAEVFDRQRHLQEGLLAAGATLSLTRRLSDKGADRQGERSGDKAGDWWLTIVGEVPASTLTSFAQGLERKK
jgi:sigma-E factor negative regulatory protein RseB